MGDRPNNTDVDSTGPAEGDASSDEWVGEQLVTVESATIPLTTVGVGEILSISAPAFSELKNPFQAIVKATKREPITRRIPDEGISHRKVRHGAYRYEVCVKPLTAKGYERPLILAQEIAVSGDERETDTIESTQLDVLEYVPRDTLSEESGNGLGRGQWVPYRPVCATRPEVKEYDFE